MMLDDKDEFKKTSMYAELLLEETVNLSGTLASPLVVDAPREIKLGWFLFMRNFLIKHWAELDEAISARRQ